MYVWRRGTYLALKKNLVQRGRGRSTGRSLDLAQTGAHPCLGFFFQINLESLGWPSPRTGEKHQLNTRHHPHPSPNNGCQLLRSTSGYINRARRSNSVPHSDTGPPSSFRSGNGGVIPPSTGLHVRCQRRRRAERSLMFFLFQIKSNHLNLNGSW